MKQEKRLKLFTPIKMGAVDLKHRIVMAPMSRLRAQHKTGIPSDWQREYYSQRSSDGGLIITEGTAISPAGLGYTGAPGIWSDEQITGWKAVTKAVHDKSGKIFLQIWHGGRQGHIDIQGIQPAGPSVVQSFWEDPKNIVCIPTGLSAVSPHRALEMHEISEIVQDFRKAATNAKKAGFDGIDLHAAHGHLIDQFLQDGSNLRTDKYGGSIENRARFLFEIIEATTAAMGDGRVGITLSLGSTYAGMGDTDYLTLACYISENANKYKLAYLRMVEPRVAGIETISLEQPPIVAQKMSKIFKGVFIAAGGFEPDTAEKAVADETAALVSFGRHFVSNPDLPARIKNAWPLTAADRNTYYAWGKEGYIDYPKYE